MQSDAAPDARSRCAAGGGLAARTAGVMMSEIVDSPDNNSFMISVEVPEWLEALLAEANLLALRCVGRGLWTRERADRWLDEIEEMASGAVIVRDGGAPCP